MTGPSHPTATAPGLTPGLPPVPKPAASLDFSTQRQAFIKAAQKLEVHIDNSSLSEKPETKPIVNITVSAINTLQEILTELARRGSLSAESIMQHRIKLAADTANFILHDEGIDKSSGAPKIDDSLKYTKSLLKTGLNVVSLAESGDMPKVAAEFTPVIKALEEKAGRTALSADKQRVYERSVESLLS